MCSQHLRKEACNHYGVTWLYCVVYRNKHRGSAMGNVTHSPAKWEAILRERSERMGAPFVTPNELAQITGIKADRLHQAAYTGAIGKVAPGRYRVDDSLMAFINRRSSKAGFRIASTQAWLQAAKKMMPNGAAENPGAVAPRSLALSAMSDALQHTKNVVEEVAGWVKDLEGRVEKVEAFNGNAPLHEHIRAASLLARLVKMGAPEDVLLQTLYALFDGSAE